MPIASDEDRIALWSRVLDDDAAPLLAGAADADPSEVRDVSRLRKRWSHDLVRIAFELIRARRRAQKKFPNPDAIVADVAGVEQATSHLVAAHKAERFARAGATSIIDLCCGIGGDAMALARVADVEAVDHDALRAWMASRNAPVTATCADVESIAPQGRAMHLDPGRRRADGRRTWHYEDYVPGPDTIERLLAASPDAALKLGPGIDFDALPFPDAEIELISEHGRLVQAVLYQGTLTRAPGARTATRLPGGDTFTGTPRPWPDRWSESETTFDRCLFVPDPALERAGLVAAALDGTAAREAFPGLGLVTAPDRLSEEVANWFTLFEVEAELPWRIEHIRAWLRDHDAGMVEVKTRGGAIEVDSAHRRLRGDGATAWTVFGLRLGRKLVAVITRRVTE